MNTNKISEVELEILTILWKTKESVTAKNILMQLKEKRDWKLSSLMAFLGRMEGKGYIEIKKEANHNFYLPVIEEQEFKQDRGKSILGTIYKNSFKDLVLALYKGNSITKSDIDEITEYFKDLE